MLKKSILIFIFVLINLLSVNLLIGQSCLGVTASYSNTNGAFPYIYTNNGTVLFEMLPGNVMHVLFTDNGFNYQIGATGPLMMTTVVISDSSGNVLFRRASTGLTVPGVGTIIPPPVGTGSWSVWTTGGTPADIGYTEIFYTLAPGDVPATFDFGYWVKTPNGTGGTTQAFYTALTGNVPASCVSGLIGPNGNPAAVGATDNNDDYTNQSILANVPSGGVLTASATEIFTNTVRNDGGSADSFVITAPSVPAGLTVEASPDCVSYTTISGGGSITTSSLSPSATQNICIRVTVPSGSPTYTAYPTTIRATSVTDGTKVNDTIDRLYTGFVTTTKTASVSNTTGVGGATDPVPGAEITYFINYQNIANTPVGSGNYDLTATNFVITEDGSLLPNNWATYTTHLPGFASDSLGGSISGDTAGSNLLTDTVSAIAPGMSGVFSFKRRIN